MSKRFSDEDDQLIKREYPTTTDLDDLCRRLDRPLKAIRRRAFALKVQRRVTVYHRHRLHVAPAHEETHKGPWHRRCDCGTVFIALTIDHVHCEDCAGWSPSKSSVPNTLPYPSRPSSASDFHSSRWPAVAFGLDGPRTRLRCSRVR